MTQRDTPSKFKVFVSSRLDDFKELRGLLQARAGFKEGNEVQFVLVGDDRRSYGGSVRELSFEHLDNADLVVFILGSTYGSEPHQGYSHTEAEWVRAVENGYPWIAFATAEEEDIEDAEARAFLSRVKELRVVGRLSGDAKKDAKKVVEEVREELSRLSADLSGRDSTFANERSPVGGTSGGTTEGTGAGRSMPTIELLAPVSDGGGPALLRADGHEIHWRDDQENRLLWAADGPVVGLCVTVDGSAVVAATETHLEIAEFKADGSVNVWQSKPSLPDSPSGHGALLSAYRSGRAVQAVFAGSQTVVLKVDSAGRSTTRRLSGFQPDAPPDLTSCRKGLVDAELGIPERVRSEGVAKSASCALSAHTGVVLGAALVHDMDDDGRRIVAWRSDAEGSEPEVRAAEVANSTVEIAVAPSVITDEPRYILVVGESTQEWTTWDRMETLR